MRADRYVLEVLPEGKLDLPPLDFAPGTSVEVIVLPVNGDDDLDDNPARLSSLLGNNALMSIWDNPEEDEAWRDL